MTQEAENRATVPVLNLRLWEGREEERAHYFWLFDFVVAAWRQEGLIFEGNVWMCSLEPVF